jgi:hypothetical protein
MEEGTVPVPTAPAHCDGAGITRSGVIAMGKVALRWG